MKGQFVLPSKEEREAAKVEAAKRAAEWEIRKTEIAKEEEAKINELKKNAFLKILDKVSDNIKRSVGTSNESITEIEVGYGEKEYESEIVEMVLSSLKTNDDYKFEVGQFRVTKWTHSYNSDGFPDDKEYIAYPLCIKATWD